MRVSIYASIVALLTMPVGISLVEYGPLQGWVARFRQIRIPAADGGPVTLSSMTGLPFWALTLILGGATLAWALARSGRKVATNPAMTDSPGGVRFHRPWKAWQAGIAIGLLALPAYLSSAASGRNYPLGVTHGVLYSSVLLTDAPVEHVIGVAAPATPPADAEAPTPRKRVVWWLVLLVGIDAEWVSPEQLDRLPDPQRPTRARLARGLLAAEGK